MINVKLRDFQRYLHKLLKDKQDINVIDQHGRIIAHLIIAAELSNDERSEAITPQDLPQYPNNIGMTDGQLAGVITSQNWGHLPVDIGIPGGHLVQELKLCTKCKRVAEYSGTIWEDGEEVNGNLCQNCYKSWPNKKAFKLI